MKKRLIALLALINDNNEVLISLRQNRIEYDGYWEYPGGKVENSETLEKKHVEAEPIDENNIAINDDPMSVNNASDPTNKSSS